MGHSVPKVAVCNECCVLFVRLAILIDSWALGGLMDGTLNTVNNQGTLCQNYILLSFLMCSSAVVVYLATAIATKLQYLAIYCKLQWSSNFSNHLNFAPVLLSSQFLRT